MNCCNVNSFSGKNRSIDKKLSDHANFFFLLHEHDFEEHVKGDLLSTLFSVYGRNKTDDDSFIL